MKPSTTTKFTKTPKASVFQTAARKPVAKSKTAALTAKPPKRDNIFSKSRDTREDRGTRQMKTMNRSQTLPHGSNVKP
jgi:hypothetical protein